ncbi:MAG: sigma-70 family RNA polymerase sigma factor [Gemmatimonadetes bacterium]|nr:sigma-70 family RNA polymerase sigma factor [Gemmatimonadota bacterium]
MPYAELDDKELVKLAREGREPAYRELLSRYQRPVFSLVYRMVRDRATAEDLAQETFVRVFNSIDTYDPAYKFSSWIFKIGNNLAIDHLRKRKLDTLSIEGSPHATTADQQESSRITVEAGGENPEQYVVHRELGSHIERAIGDLRPEYRTAITLRHVEGYSYEEIAEVMELPLGTVKTYIHRARSELKERLGHLVE